MTRHKAYKEIAGDYNGDVSNIDKHLLAAICKEPWAITQDGLDTVLYVANRMADSNFESLLIDDGKSLPNTDVVSVRGSTAVINITGPIFRYANLLTRMSGASSIEVLARDFNAAMVNDAVENIVLNIDSPGGQVAGVSEFAALIKNSNKNVIAYVDGLGASAAYWIASAADKIFANNTSLIGSIGVVLSARQDEETNTIKIRSSQSPNKQLGMDTDEGKAQMQVVVDDLAKVFVSTVAINRGVDEETVLEEFGKGGVMVGAKAVDAGMIDGLAALETLIAGNSGVHSEVFTMKDEKVIPDVTVDFIKVNHPAIAQHFRAEGENSINKDELIADGRAEGVKAEHDRIMGIEKLSIPGHEKLIASMKADPTTTPEMAAVKLVQAEQERKVVDLRKIEEDGLDVTVAASVDEDNKAPVTAEQKWEKMSADEKAQFGNDYDSYVAFEEADSAGLVKIYSK